MLDKVSSLFIDRVALPILNMSITAGIIILIVLLVRVLLKKAPKIFSYALWGIVLFRLLCPISFSSSVSVFNLLNHPKVNFGEMSFVVKDERNDVAEGNQGQNTNLEPYIPEYVDANKTAFSEGEGFKGNLGEKDVDKAFGGNGKDDSAVMPDNEVDENHDNPLASLAEGVAHTQQIFSWTYFFCGIWILGIVALSLSNAIRYIRLRKRVSVSLPLRENIYLCDEIQVPFCLGVINPKIYLPSGLGKEEMKYIILHEKHHIRRLDHVVKVLAFIALCIHWPNPLVWVAFVLAGRDMEMSCDEAIMRKMDKDIRAQYSASLLHLATGRKVFTSSTLSFGEGNPKQRIKNIMNYKKPAFWVIVLSVAGCIAVSVTLLSNPVIQEDAIPSESEMMKESINESGESQQNPVSPGETTESEEGLENTENSLFHPEYERLIQLAEEVCQDPIRAQEEYKQYVDENGEWLFSTEFFIKSDDTSQELGYLVQDINGDGIKELMFGVNWQFEDNEEHIIFDLYTLKNDKAVHVFDGGWRSRYYPTDDGNFILDWSASAYEHGYTFYEFDGENLSRGEEIPEENLEKYDIVYPYFIPFGADWEELEDILDNTFPISIVKGEGQFEAMLSVAGLDKEISINFENRYNYWKKASDDTAESASFAQRVKNHYDQEVLNMKKGSVCAHTSTWGVWNIHYGTYEGQECLIAEQGIEGYSKEDLWGNVFIYFDYDTNGKIRILDLTFVPYEEGTTFDDSMEFLEHLTKATETIQAFAQEDVKVIPEVAEYTFEDACKKGQVQEITFYNPTAG